MGSEPIEQVQLLVTCKVGMERIAASYIRELIPQASIVSAPHGFLGLILVSNIEDPYKVLSEVKAKVPEVERVYPILESCKASLDEIVRHAKKLAGYIHAEESFAVVTVRRGKHDFKSLDVNVAVGAAVKDLTGAKVDLENPDKVLVVQILHNAAYLTVVQGSEFHKKMKPYKFPMYKFFRKLAVAHEPYLGPGDAAYSMGTRIGREVQTYELGKLYVAPIGPVEAEPLYYFLKGLFEGARSRYEIQKKSYGREVHRTVFQVQDMYQWLRSRMGRPLIIFEPEGEPISRVGNELTEFIVSNIRKGREIGLMVGAREGVPTGLFRYADFILDVAPGVVISTEYALSSALVALTTVLHEALVQENEF